MDAASCERALLAAVRHHNAGATDAARTLYRQALAIDPAQPDALRLLAILDWRDGGPEQAIAKLRRAATAAPGTPAPRLVLATALDAAGRGAAAAGTLRRAIALDPADVQSWAAAAHRATRTGCPTEALAAWRAVATLCPDRPAALMGLAGALRDNGQAEAALRTGKRALALEPAAAAAHADLALMFEAVADISGAVTVYRRAIRIAPDLVEAHVNIALRLLHLGRIGEGWEHYARRLAQDPRTRRQALPPWRGEDLAGRRILVWGEQGLGDEVMFASCLPDLVARAGHVTVLCEPRLVPLFARSFPEATVRPLPDENEEGGFDTGDAVQAAIGSLPLWFRPDANAFPRRCGYLRAEPRETGRFRERLSGAGPAVGVAWHTVAEGRRSIPLQALADALPGARLVNVQYGEHEPELTAVEARRGGAIARFPDASPLDDLELYAALLSALDLVVTIDNSTAHLAGALGVPTWILLPSPPDWRWFGGIRGCLWYPQARLFRQHRSGDWSGALADVAAAFRLFLTLHGQQTADEGKDVVDIDAEIGPHPS